MNWYAAHLVMVVEWKDGRQKHFPFWENIVLVQAASEEQAFARAEKRGKKEEGDDDGSFRWNGRPARWVFAGVRKLTLCSESTRRPGDGSEVSFLEFEAPSRDALEKYLQGKEVALKCTDRFAEPHAPATAKLVS